MPENTTENKTLALVETLTAVLTGAGVVTPILFGAVRGVIAALRQTDVAELPTDAEVIEALRTKAMANRDANIQWLRDHGFAD